MKNRIKKLLPDHILAPSQAKHIYVVDYKNSNGGNVCLLEKEPTEIKYVYLNNNNETAILFDGFKENALPIKKGQYNRQCECVIFPEICDVNDWILFIETKYTENIEKAFKEEYGYPLCMVDQIIETVNFFRLKGILEPDKRATAIVSFPNLIEEFNSTLFAKIEAQYGSVEDILNKYKILIRATNAATIISSKRLKLSNI